MNKKEIKKEKTNQANSPVSLEDYYWHELKKQSSGNEHHKINLDISLSENISIKQKWSDEAIDMFNRYIMPEEKITPDELISTVCQRIQDNYKCRFGDDQSLFKILNHAIKSQMCSFNSPVWFNVRRDNKEPQTAACFINKLDNVAGIPTLLKEQAEIYKNGSGSGVNISALEEEPEYLLQLLDTLPGRSALSGKRRGALSVLMNTKNKFITKFIQLKSKEESWMKEQNKDNKNNKNKMAILSRANYQNFNSSVVSDSYLAESDKLIDTLVDAIYNCGDPGIYFKDNVNKNSMIEETISGANPCFEFLFRENTCCNLASINLMKFITRASYSQPVFNWNLFRIVVWVLAKALNVIIDFSGYPSPEFKAGQLKYRPIGLGITNLYALFMALKMDDVKKQEDFSEALSATLTWNAFFGANYEIKIRSVPNQRIVIDYAEKMNRGNNKTAKFLARCNCQMARCNCQSGFCEVTPASPGSAIVPAHLTFVAPRDSARQNSTLFLTCIAPTGRLSIIMDCLTTGAERIFSYESLKQRKVSDKLLKLVFSIRKEPIDKLQHYLQKESFIASSSGQMTKNNYLNEISVISALQSRLTGGISKTINLQKNTSKADIRELLEAAHNKGIKAISFYRDTSKITQPMVSNKINHNSSERDSLTKKFVIGGVTGYLIIEFNKDTSIKGIFIIMLKPGSTVNGLLTGIAILTSKLLEHGMTIDEISSYFIGTQFEPSGITNTKDIKFASSILDFIFRYLQKVDAGKSWNTKKPSVIMTGDICSSCGALKIKTGTCSFCPICGESGGCE